MIRNKVGVEWDPETKVIGYLAKLIQLCKV